MVVPPEVIVVNEDQYPVNAPAPLKLLAGMTTT